jgi:hypothetical protein
MTKLIDTVAASLLEIEEQMLDEFNRIRNTVSNNRFGVMDTGIKNALLEVLNIVHNSLEHSGDAANLQLLTTQQENLFSRMVVIRQLLNARVPTAFLHDAHDNIEKSRQQAEQRKSASKQRVPADITITDIASDKASEKASSKDKTLVNDRNKGGLLELVKGMFKRNPTDPDFKRKRLYITEQEAKILVEQEIYLNNGVYSAAQELALLAGMIAEETDQLDSTLKATDATSQPTGRATFKSRDISHTITPVGAAKPIVPKPSPVEHARSPEAIRQKLAARQSNQTTGKARFGSRDIESLNERTRLKIPDAPMSRKASFISRDTESGIQRDVMKPKTNQAVPASTGRATFASRDIEPVVPQQAPRRRIPEPTRQPVPEPPKPTGKAVFESRDVGQQPTKPR